MKAFATYIVNWDSFDQGESLKPSVNIYVYYVMFIFGFAIILVPRNYVA